MGLNWALTSKKTYMTQCYCTQSKTSKALSYNFQTLKLSQKKQKQKKQKKGQCKHDKVLTYETRFQIIVL